MSKVCIECGSKLDHYKELCNRCYGRKHYHKNKARLRTYQKNWNKNNHEKYKLYHARKRLKMGMNPMSENRDCALFLGVHVAERVLSNVFDNVIKQPHGNPGFDFICNKGMKIDVKCSCLNYRKDSALRWKFKICKNKIADYFLCLALDNRQDLTPMHMWLIPASDINDHTSISSTTTMISKWDKYALNIDKVSACCNVLRLQK